MVKFIYHVLDDPDAFAVLAVIVFAVVIFIILRENWKANKKRDQDLRQLELEREVKERVQEELKKRGIEKEDP